MDIDYPPTQTYRLGTALADARDDPDVPDGHVDALEWAVHGDGRDEGFDGWGKDAELELSGMTTGRRSQAIDAINTHVVGDVGERKVQDWIVAAGITAAPWKDPDTDFREHAEIVEQLPPALTDWLEQRQQGLNDLGGADEGN
jgi:hypothetical protein